MGREGSDEMEHEYRRLGDLLRQAGAISEKQLEEALERQRSTGLYLGATLIAMGVLTEERLLKTLQQQLGLPLVDLEQVSVDEQALSLVSEEVAKRHSVLPLEVVGR